MTNRDDHETTHTTEPDGLPIDFALRLKLWCKNGVILPPDEELAASAARPRAAPPEDDEEPPTRRRGR